MNHSQALQEMAVERYLLGELSGASLDQFEEHLFDCTACSQDVKTGAAFVALARVELAKAPVHAIHRSQGWLNWFARPSFLAPALAACLVVVAVQSLVILPRTRTGQPATPAAAILNNLVLADAGPRGNEALEVVAPAHGSFALSIDVPTRDGFSGYQCLLYAPGGALVWQGSVSTDQARDPVTLSVPTDLTTDGRNVVVVQGLPDSETTGGKATLATYAFNVRILK